MAFGIQRRPLDNNVQYTDADLAAMNADQGGPLAGGGAVDLSPETPGSAGGVVGQAPPQMPTMMPPASPRVEFGGPTQVSPPPMPSTGGPMGAPGPSTATPSMSNEPTPVAGQPPNPAVAGGPSAPPVMPPSFTPMDAPLGGQQIAQAAYPIQRQDPSLDPSYGGWAGASDASASYPITRRTVGPGPMTGGAGTQNRLLGAAGGLLGGGLGVPGLTGGSTQEHTDIGNLIAQLYRMANQNTQG
jgi:hypothetical protein